ncbi:MAG: hypothetical protein DCC43_05745 [Candidatus Brocadia sp.]|uniref:Flagellar assembly protein T C-terminal domain-containing protein n=1 Tax=Candidatus Brocadia fulgida TaxID=380242 RepID=A0A0M2UWZ7_9BACT|nr:MAG: hypothetical protein BROFUL_01165 [Candidatus Brocadia fulgida]MCC6325732.1 hypothetical protein [Candidatus Brocadia sp.]MCE7911439.1 hypothetical protein [Candidatus Brocadia sp. AMX3]MBV6519857.1 hypothetical protein [Candidatus Brocadia fulgida]MDG5995373.1 hypothetical protein [Candidatus Brocadia sp.]
MKKNTRYTIPQRSCNHVPLHEGDGQNPCKKGNGLYGTTILRCTLLIAGLVFPLLSRGALSDTAKDTTPPVVHTDVTPAVVHDTHLFLSGEACDNNGIARVLVNGCPLEIHTGRRVSFNHLLPLREGRNIVTVQAIDASGNASVVSPVKITRKAFDLPETVSRYAVALLPVKSSPALDMPGESIHSLFLKAFGEEPQRFHFVERDPARLEGILREQRISKIGQISPETVIKIGKIIAAEGLFLVTIDEDVNGIGITLRLVDTETGRIRAQASVHDADNGMKNLEWLIYGLSLKIKRQLPAAQGNVIRISENGFYVNTGAAHGIEVGMKLLLFREIREGNFVLKEPLDTIARVERVLPHICFVTVSREGISRVEKGDLVLAK